MIRSEEEGDDGLPISNSIPARSVMGVSDLDKQAGICQSRMPGFSYIHRGIGFLSVYIVYQMTTAFNKELSATVYNTFCTCR